MTTVYRKVRDGDGVEVFFDSGVASWEDWPEDVVETLRAWNRDGRLRFAVMGVFRCRTCERFVDATDSTAVVFDGLHVCDDCLIAPARRYGRLGRPETELEKAKRWQRAAQKKIARYRHNALSERAYVERLKGASVGFLNAYREASLSDGEGILAGVDPAAMRELWDAVDTASDVLDLAIQGRDA